VTPERFKELVTLYALGALDAEERADVEEFLASPACDRDCVRALAQAMESAAMLTRELPPVQPGPDVWAKIEARLGLGAARQVVPLPVRSKSRGAIWAAVAVGWAAAAVFLFLWWRDGQKVQEFADAARAAEKRARMYEGQVKETERHAVSAGHERDACRRRLESLELGIVERDAAIALLELPGTQLFALKPEPGRELAANAIVHTGLKRAYIAFAGFKPQAGKDYELWVVHGEKVLAAGLIKGDPEGRALVRVDYEALTGELPEKLLVTLEPEGGGPVARGPLVLGGSLKI
jgi:anti-sigma-K factor RskA